MLTRGDTEWVWTSSFTAGANSGANTASRRKHGDAFPERSETPWPASSWVYPHACANARVSSRKGYRRMELFQRGPGFLSGLT